MGDYSVACGITGLSMMNQEVVLFPLVKSWEGKRHEDKKVALRGGSYIVSNNGAFINWDFMCLPLFGKIGDAADFTIKDERDNIENVDRVAEFLGVGVHKFTEAIIYGADKSVTNPVLKDSGGMFVHRDAWDHALARKSKRGDGFGWGDCLYKAIAELNRHVEDRRREEALVADEEAKGEPSEYAKLVRKHWKTHYSSHARGFGLWDELTAYQDWRRDEELRVQDFVQAVYGNEKGLFDEKWRPAFEELWKVYGYMYERNRLVGPTWNGPQYPFENAKQAIDLATLTTKLARKTLRRYK